MDTARLLVMDVLRGSLNDGPGIRTTVFTKGCPLRCRWCHNPESQDTKPELSFEASKCQFCGECASVCPQGAHIVMNGMHQLDRNLCIACGSCAPTCPAESLKVVGEWWEPEALVDLAARDKKYYDRSGGGLTISGGEPMAQFRPVLATLRLSKSAGLHNCLDTCGQAPLEQYLEVLPFVDLFLWDVKATGPKLHKTLTGVDGGRIERNLAALASGGAKIRLRCPMIPGLNDTPEHFARIAELDRNLPGLDGIDLMPYHSFARDKAQKVGMVQDGLPKESATQEQIGNWLEQLAALGCERVTIG